MTTLTSLFDWAKDTSHKLNQAIINTPITGNGIYECAAKTNEYELNVVPISPSDANNFSIHIKQIGHNNKPTDSIGGISIADNTAIITTAKTSYVCESISEAQMTLIFLMEDAIKHQRTNDLITHFIATSANHRDDMADDFCNDVMNKAAVWNGVTPADISKPDLLPS